MYEIFLDYKLVHSEENKAVKEFVSVSVFAGDNWNNTLNGRIKGLIIC